MLPKKNILTKDKEFSEVFKFGKSSYDKLLGVKALRKEDTVIKFGIIVSAKVSKKATDRNKIKRQIREILHSLLDIIKPGYKIVILTLPAIKDRKFKEVKNSLIYNLKKLKLLTR